MSILKTYVQDLESDAFDAEEYVERLAWRLTEDVEGPLDANCLHSALEEEIGNLQILSDQCQAKIEGLENSCREEEEEYYLSLERLLAEHEVADKKLKCLNERINAVAVRVVHLGDQLQSMSTPRSRAHEALQLVLHFTDFLDDRTVVSDVFSDPDKLLEAGEIIYKLNLIAHELPVEKFGEVRKRISDKYAEVETMLIDAFSRFHLAGNKIKLKEITAVLAQFKGYSHCVDTFVGQCQIQAFRGNDIFADVLALCTSKCGFIQEVFPTPQQIMAKLILNIFRGKLQEYISTKLNNREDDPEGRLNDLFELYTKTKALISELLKVSLVASEKEFLSTLVRVLFAGYLNGYINLETNYLHDQCSLILQKFYASAGHQKKSLPTSGLQELKRDLQARLMPESYGNETLLSEEVAISILQETKSAFQRCQTLSSPAEVVCNLQQLVNILIRYLCREHIEYAVDLAANNVQTEKQCSNFLRVVRQTAAIFHLFEKQFEDSVVPLFRNRPQEKIILAEKQEILQSIEKKIGRGTDKVLNAMIAHVRSVLSTEQKKTDFKPDAENLTEIPLCSHACSVVCKYVARQIDLIRDCLDGGNLEAVLTELTLRFHRAIVDNIYQYQYTSQGAMLLLCDVSEYRKVIAGLELPFVSKLFEVLNALCNLLIVSPDNLSSACSSGMLSDVERSVIVGFVQLRADYKTARINVDF